jgi:hypothetical protein
MVIGIILIGLLGDGTFGIYAVKRCGGTCIVQNADDSDYADMPHSVLNRLQVDYRLLVAAIGERPIELAGRPVLGAPPVPRELAVEAKITENMTTTIIWPADERFGNFDGGFGRISADRIINKTKHQYCFQIKQLDRESI